MWRSIGHSSEEVKRAVAFFGLSAYGAGVRRKTETLDDLLRDCGVRDDEGLTAFAERAGITPRTLLRLRQGLVEKPHAGTLKLLSLALKVPVDRVAQAVAASGGH